MAVKIPREWVVAARLADPTTRGQVSFGQAVEWSAVLRVLVANKVPLHGLQSDPLLEDCPLLSNEGFLKAAHTETRIWRSLRDEYGKVRQALLAKGIQSVLLKSCGLPPSFPYTSDNLDTLVRPEHASLSRQVLNALGYVELRNVEEPQKWLFRKFIGGESISAIHLHGVVGWGVPFLDDSALWKRALISDDDPWAMVPSPQDAFLITIAHAFYENKSFKLLDIVRIRHCLRQRNFDFSDVQRIARERGWEDGLAFCLLLYRELEAGLYGETLIPNAVLNWAESVVSANTWVSGWLDKTLKRDEARFPFRLSFFFGKTLYYRKILHDQQRKRPTRMHDVVSTFIWGVKHTLHLSTQRGMIVSLSGIDGAGKTVHSLALVKALETSEIKAYVYWNRFGSSAHKIDSGAHEAGRGYHSDVATSLARRRARLQNPLMQSAWLGLHLIGYVTHCTLHVSLPHWLGGVVVCDRYIYDAAVEIGASLPDGEHWTQRAERLLTLLCPRPDVAWLLDVPAELSIGREGGDNSVAAACEELSKQRSKFKSLASTYGLRVLPTGDGLDQTSSQVVRETLVKYYGDYHTWLNAFLLSNPNQMNPKAEL